MDTPTLVPTVEFLHSLHVKAFGRLQALFDEEILDKVGINPPQLVPLTLEEAIFRTKYYYCLSGKLK
jgi:hypothetical protein